MNIYLYIVFSILISSLIISTFVMNGYIRFRDHSISVDKLKINSISDIPQILTSADKLTVGKDNIIELGNFETINSKINGLGAVVNDIKLNTKMGRNDIVYLTFLEDKSSTGTFTVLGKELDITVDKNNYIAIYNKTSERSKISNDNETSNDVIRTFGSTVARDNHIHSLGIPEVPLSEINDLLNII